MPKPTTPHTVLLSPEELCAETFRKFGIETSPDHKISQEAVQVIACLARACLPVIGEHCRSAVRLHEAKLRIAAERPGESLDIDSGNFSKTTEDLHREHKRLVAQKEVDRAVAAACQSSIDLLNRGGHVLQKAAPLLPVPHILSEHLQSLKQIHVPKLVRPEGDLQSIPNLFEVASRLDEVAKYSVLRFLQTRVYDPCDGMRSINVLSKAISDVNNELRKFGSTPQDARLGKNILRISAHVCGMKKLASEVQKLCVDRENISAKFGEEIAERCLKILTRKIAKLNELQLYEGTDFDQMHSNENLRESVAKIIWEVGEKITNNETIEVEIKSTFREICTSRELHINSNLLPLPRNPYQISQAILPVCTPPGNTLPTLNETLLVDELETRMEKLEIDPQENVTAREYLASLEFGVDASKIHSTILIPSGNVQEVVNELTNFEIVSFVEQTPT